MKRVRPSRSLTSDVLESLRAAIINGELVPGSLHSVHTLASQLGVSRTPVREALIQLAGQNMVRFERNRGFRILQTTVHDLEEIFALRLLLEVPATRRAVAQFTTADLTQLRHQFAAMQRAADAGDERAMMDRDRQFHQVILRASGNQRLAAYVDNLRDVVLVRGASTAGHSRTLQDIVDEHRPILDHAEAGHPNEAADAMRAHIAHTAELLVSKETGHPGELDLRWADPDQEPPTAE